MIRGDDAVATGALRAIVDVEEVELRSRTTGALSSSMAAYTSIDRWIEVDSEALPWPARRAERRGVLRVSSLSSPTSPRRRFVDARVAGRGGCFVTTGVTAVGKAAVVTARLPELEAVVVDDPFRAAPAVFRELAVTGTLEAPPAVAGVATEPDEPARADART